MFNTSSEIDTLGPTERIEGGCEFDEDDVNLPAAKPFDESLAATADDDDDDDDDVDALLLLENPLCELTRSIMFF